MSERAHAVRLWCGCLVAVRRGRPRRGCAVGHGASEHEATRYTVTEARRRAQRIHGAHVVQTTARRCADEGSE